MTAMREDAEIIIRECLASVMPDQAVKKALQQLPAGSGKLYVIAIGKAGWQMASAASHELGGRIADGVCITKYGHIKGDIPHIRCFEAGHPVPDEHSVQAARQAEALVHDLKPEDTVLMLISGGGSALFEDPLVSLQELQNITGQQLACGADITEINIIRKRLSKVKGGQFAQLCMPAKVFSIILSDIIGDPLDMIASGPTVPDCSTLQQVQEIIAKYHLNLSQEARTALLREMPAQLTNAFATVTGSVKQLCAAAMQACQKLGYEPHFLSASLTCEAREAGRFLAAIARDHQNDGKSIAFICGGETVVHLCGKGLGGRNQELALAASQGIAGLQATAVFSLGSDGTDGPTDAAGGYVDQNTAALLAHQGISIPAVLADNDSYHALSACHGLLITGPTGTNVNDLAVLLIRR